MADFPDIQFPSSRNREFAREQIRPKFEDGKAGGRPKYSKGHWRWTLEWDLLSSSDSEILRQHFDSNAGGSFLCAAAMLDAARDFTVSYAMDTFSMPSTKTPNYFKVKVILEEA